MDSENLGRAAAAAQYLAASWAAILADTGLFLIVRELLFPFTALLFQAYAGFGFGPDRQVGLTPLFSEVPERLFRAALTLRCRCIYVANLARLQRLTRKVRATALFGAWKA